MNALNLATAGHQSFWLSSRVQLHLSGTFRQGSSAANSKLNLIAIEAKWKATWTSRQSKKQDCEFRQRIYHPLEPLYYEHLKTPTILDALTWCNSMKGVAAAPRNSKTNMIDRILELAKSQALNTVSQCPGKNSMDVKTCIDTYGTDVTRTYVVFRSQIPKNPLCYENGVVQIKQWFEMIWKAISLAHDSYMVSQTAPPDLPNIPEAFYEPNLDTWEDFISDEPRSWVHIPPEVPDILDSMMLGEDCKVWLAAQKALVSMARPLSVQNNVRTVESRLVALTKAIIVYDDAQIIVPGVHYHSARILLCLIAPLAPAFAEECWVMLHYGSDMPSDGENDDDDHHSNPPDLLVDESIEQELADDEELRNLPRQGRPETLPSIFDQAFPVAEQKEVIDLLRSPLLLSEARATKSAQMKAQQEERVRLATEKSKYGSK